MSAMASQITGVSIVYSAVIFRPRSEKISNLCVTGICERNSPVTGEFPAQRASNAERIPFDDVIMDRKLRIAYVWCTVQQSTNQNSCSICCTSHDQSGRMNEIQTWGVFVRSSAPPTTNQKPC